MKYKWLYHEPSGWMAIAMPMGSLTLIHLCEEDPQMMNPVVAYPVSMLKWSGWIEIGEI